MIVRLFFLFTITTLVEMFLLVKLASLTSFMTTLALVLVTGSVGAWLARREGLKVWTDIRQQLARGEVPGASLVDALCILVAGAFLMTPGLLTDTAGFLLLIPGFRSLLRARLLRFFESQLMSGNASVRFVGFGSGGGVPFGGPGGMGGMSGRTQDLGVQEARPLQRPSSLD